MSKQVNQKYYNKKYFDFQSVSPDFSKKLNKNDFHRKYQEISSLIKIKPTDSICDFGCGNGDLSFLLYLKYRCRITAIDYSIDAIKICRSKLINFKKNTINSTEIKFLNRDNQHLPNLKNIKAIFFCDVFEHLYPDEIRDIIQHFHKWGNPLIIVHTDNNIYLNFIQPLLNLVRLLTKKTTISQLRHEKKFDQKRHINLTNPNQLRQTMKRYQYIEQKMIYPEIKIEAIANQLGQLSKFKKLIKISFYLCQHFPFLSPSFYAIYSFKES